MSATPQPPDVITHALAEERAAERLLEVAHVAKRLRCHPETVRRYIRRGLLRHQRRGHIYTRRGGNYLIPESALREFLATSGNTLRLPPR